MDMIAVEFQQGVVPAATQSDIVEIFRRYNGATPPAGYADFAASYGGTRFPSGRRYIFNRDTGEQVGVGTVYHYDARVAQYSVQDIWAQTKGQLPAGLVPVASSEFGGEICFDYRVGAAENPAVVLFDYEAMQGREVTRLADNFSSFLSGITTLA